MDRSLNLPCPTVLHVFYSAGLCLIDTCSDVSLARRDVLHSLQLVDDSVVISHLGGESRFDEVGSFALEGERRPPVVLLRVFAVDETSLPAGVVALLGVADVRSLGLSLDAIAAKPGCHWEQALPPRSISRALSNCWAWLTSCCSRRDSQTEQRSLLPLSPPRRLQAPAIDASLNGSPPVMPPRRYLAELRAKSLLAQEARTVDRIGRLFVQRSSSSKRRSPSAPPHTDESAKPMLPRRGKGSKWR